jgi:hypothetical protein
VVCLIQPHKKEEELYKMFEGFRTDSGRPVINKSVADEIMALINSRKAIMVITAIFPNYFIVIGKQAECCYSI